MTTTNNAVTPAKTCCNTSVGVLFLDGLSFLLMLRPDGKGWANVSGHALDTHTDYEDAAITEASEEVDLTVISLRWLTGGWSDNRCKRAPGWRGYGHEWRVALATQWTGQVSPSPREVAGIRWATPVEIAGLARRTHEAAVGRVTAGEWAADPGLEAIHCRWFAELGVIDLSAGQLQAIDAFGVLGVPQS